MSNHVGPQDFPTPPHITTRPLTLSMDLLAVHPHSVTMHLWDTAR